MTYNTKTEIDRVRKELVHVTEKIIAVQTEHEKQLLQIKQELLQTIQAQREEIVRLRIELEQAHKKDRYRRLAAKRRLGK